MSATTPTHVLGRTTVIRAENARTLTGRDLLAGMILPTGLVLQVEPDDRARDVRLEMPGADVHFIGYDEPVTVLATVEADVLDAISLGTFLARAEQRRRPARRAVEVIEQISERVPRAVRRAATVVRNKATDKQNRGPVGQYADDVRHYVDVCPVHGETTFARHRAGRNRRGEQRYNDRCLKCHTDYNLDNRSTTTSQEG